MIQVFIVLIEVFVTVGITFFIFHEPSLSKGLELTLPIILGGAVTNLVSRIMTSWGHIRILGMLLLLTIQKKPLRISFATLIRIKHNNKFLLVKSKRNPLFQPPGGVLRFYDKNIRARFSLIDDQSYQTIPDDEFRLRFPSGKLWKVFNFLDWFDRRIGRELDPHREFYEELIDTNILTTQVFSKPQFCFIKRAIPPISFSKHFGIHELFLFEIFEIILNEEQKKEIESLQKITSSNYEFLTSVEIEKMGYKGTVTAQIGSHTHYILNDD